MVLTTARSELANLQTLRIKSLQTLRIKSLQTLRIKTLQTLHFLRTVSSRVASEDGSRERILFENSIALTLTERVRVCVSISGIVNVLFDATLCQKMDHTLRGHKAYIGKICRRHRHLTHLHRLRNSPTYRCLTARLLPLLK